MASSRPASKIGSLFRFGSGRSSALAGKDTSDPAAASSDARPSTSHSGRYGSSVELRPVQANLEDKVQRLPNDMQETFHRLLGEMYNQETTTMIRFIDEARRSLALSLNELTDEQEVLSLTSNKIAENRLNSATDGGSTSRPRLGAQSARHRKTPAPSNQPEPKTIPKIPRSRSNVSRGALTPMSLTPRPITARAISPRLLTSLDRVTIESELMKNRAKAEQERVDVHPVPKSAFAVPYDPAETDARLNKEYQEEKDAIMMHVSGAQSRLDTERERQAALLRDRKDQQKVKQQQTEEKAMALVREVTAVEEKQQKDKERQEQMVKEKLEEMKRRKQEEGQDGGDQARAPTPRVVNVASKPTTDNSGSIKGPGKAQSINQTKKQSELTDLE